MSSFVFPRLKPQVTTLNVNNCCYEFRCVCGSRYIGETKLTLESRASQHRTDQKSKISNHIRYCREYNIALADYGENISNERLNSTSRPSWNIPRNFHFKHYSVLGKNYKNVFHRKTSEGIFINTEILISTVKFTINVHRFSVIISLHLVGLVTGALLEALPSFFA